VSNAVFTATTIAVLAAHLGVLAWSLARRRVGSPMLALNAAAAVCILAYLFVHGADRSFSPDPQLLALAVFEAVVLAVTVWARRRSGFALAGVVIAFAIHTAASGLAVAFALLFRISRLI
jgi:hypothetical protein